jgi:hypothetical protein
MSVYRVAKFLLQNTNDLDTCDYVTTLIKIFDCDSVTPGDWSNCNWNETVRIGHIVVRKPSSKQQRPRVSRTV